MPVHRGAFYWRQIFVGAQCFAGQERRSILRFGNRVLTGRVGARYPSLARKGIVTVCGALSGGGISVMRLKIAKTESSNALFPLLWIIRTLEIAPFFETENSTFVSSFSTSPSGGVQLRSASARIYWVYAPSSFFIPAPIVADAEMVPIPPTATPLENPVVIVPSFTGADVRGRVLVLLLEVRLSGCFLKKSSAEIFFGGSVFSG